VLYCFTELGRPRGQLGEQLFRNTTPSNNRRVCGCPSGESPAAAAAFQQRHFMHSMHSSPSSSFNFCLSHTYMCLLISTFSMRCCFHVLLLLPRNPYTHSCKCLQALQQQHSTRIGSPHLHLRSPQPLEPVEPAATQPLLHSNRTYLREPWA
jgi:hypothetical protein